jgi:hypothetical protein
MAQYAPADSLIYLESNNLPAVAQSITGSDAWKEFGSNLGVRTGRPGDRWLYLAASLGIGPTEMVVLSRAQIAVIMLNVDAAEENATLRIKPEGAIIVETHTSGWRMKPVVELALQRFAERTYGPVTPQRYREDADYLEWIAAAGDRRIVAAIDGTLVVIGNSKRAVQKCLEARRGQQPSLRDDAAMRQMRVKLGANQSLTFGYISSNNATRLFSWAAPLLLGRRPGDPSLEQIISRNAAKVLGAVGWSSRAVDGEMEDRFFFSLEPSVVSRLRPVFRVGPSNGSVWKFVPGDLETITIYKSETPALAWEALRAVTSQFDALSAVVFGSILKGALLNFGIENPEKFLHAVGPELATVKIRQSSEGAVLIARTLDRPALQQMFRAQAAQASHAESMFDVKLKQPSDKSFAAAFVDDYFIIGLRENVRSCLDDLGSGKTITAQNRFKNIADFATKSSASIVTCADDTDRVRNFFLTVNALLRNSPTPNLVSPDNKTIPFAISETNLEDQGLERRTRSPLGQLSTLVGLLRRD